jgi:hypothetical protein
MRLMRLWLAAAPLAMLGLASFFAALAAGDGRWGLLALMAVLAVVAVGLFVAQGRVLRRLEARVRLRQRGG